MSRCELCKVSSELMVGGGKGREPPTTSKLAQNSEELDTTSCPPTPTPFEKLQPFSRSQKHYICTWVSNLHFCSVRHWKRGISRVTAQCFRYAWLPFRTGDPAIRGPGRSIAGFADCSFQWSRLAPPGGSSPRPPTARSGAQGPGRVHTGARAAASL